MNGEVHKEYTALVAEIVRHWSAWGAPWAT
jgi:hypothetical protein